MSLKRQLATATANNSEWDENMKTRFVVVGDLHLNHKPPSSRKDDFTASMEAKIGYVCDWCVSHGVKNVFFLGDVFNSPRQPIWFLNRCIAMFGRFGKNGIHAYSIVGNHDIFFGKLDTLEKTPIQTMFESGALIHADRCELGNVCVDLYDYPEILKKAPQDGKYHVCLAHRYYEFELSEETLRKDDLDELGYSAYVFGHDHQPYENVNNGWELVRCGSLSRGTANAYNRKRKPMFVCLEIDDSPWSLATISVTPDSLPPEDVFVELEEKKSFLSSEEEKDRFQKVVESMKSIGNGSSCISSLLSAMEMSDEARRLLGMYLAEGGIVDENSNSCL